MITPDLESLLVEVSNKKMATPESTDTADAAPAGLKTRMVMEKIVFEKEKTRTDAIQDCVKSIGSEVKRLATLLART